MLNCVTTVRNAEAKFKIKALEHPIPEVMFFNHAKFVHWFVTNNKLNPENKNLTKLRHGIKK